MANRAIPTAFGAQFVATGGRFAGRQAPPRAAALRGVERGRQRNPEAEAMTVAQLGQSLIHDALFFSVSSELTFFLFFLMYGLRPCMGHAVNTGL